MNIGNVVYINSRRGMYTVQVDNGSYSVVEIFDTYDMQLGEQIRGELDREGSCILKSINTETTFNAIVQNAGCNRDQALRKTQI